jgi:hypothetical protein
MPPPRPFVLRRLYRQLANSLTATRSQIGTLSQRLFKRISRR